MALPNLKRLLIPRKGSNKTDDLDINWRAIERWANALSESGFVPYASLTGPGETTSPGSLTQDGEFTVEGELSVVGNVNVDSSGNLYVTNIVGPSLTGPGSSLSLQGTPDVNITPTSGVINLLGNTVVTGDLTVTAASTITLDAPVSIVLGGAGSIQLGDSSTASVTLSQGPSHPMGFFGSSAVRQTVTGSRGGNAALASLLGILSTQYGLIVDSSSP